LVSETAVVANPSLVVLFVKYSQTFLANKANTMKNNNIRKMENLLIFAGFIFRPMLYETIFFLIRKN